MRCIIKKLYQQPSLIAITQYLQLKDIKFNNRRSISTAPICKQIGSEGTSVQIFDRYTKILQRERAATAKDVDLYDYLKDEIGYRLADRVFDIKRKFKLAADIGEVPCWSYSNNFQSYS